MSHVEKAQAFGRDVLEKLASGARSDMLIVAMLETCMEYLAAILDELKAKNIDRDKLRDKLRNDNEVMFNVLFKENKELIGEQPTADAAEVVRCKDCEHWTTVVDRKKAEYGLCSGLESGIGTTPKDGYCYKGERREDAVH